MIACNTGVSCACNQSVTQSALTMATTLVQQMPVTAEASLGPAAYHVQSYRPWMSLYGLRLKPQGSAQREVSPASAWHCAKHCQLTGNCGLCLLHCYDTVDCLRCRSAWPLFRSCYHQRSSQHCSDTSLLPPWHIVSAYANSGIHWGLTPLCGSLHVKKPSAMLSQINCSELFAHLTSEL